MVFGWFWNKLTDKLLDIIMDKLQDEKFWKSTLNPLLDAVVDRQIQRFQGKAGSLAKAAIPKFDQNMIMGIVIQKCFGGGEFGKTIQPQPINSSSPSEPVGT